MTPDALGSADAGGAVVVRAPDASDRIGRDAVRGTCDRPWSFAELQVQIDDRTMPRHHAEVDLLDPGNRRAGVPFSDLECDHLLGLWPSAAVAFTPPDTSRYFLATRRRDDVPTKMTVRGDCIDPQTTLQACTLADTALMDLQGGDPIHLLVASPASGTLDLVIDPEPFAWLAQESVTVDIVTWNEPPSARVTVRGEGAYKHDFLPTALELRVFDAAGDPVGEFETTMHARDADGGLFSVDRGGIVWEVALPPGELSVSVAVKADDSATWSPAIDAQVRRFNGLNDGDPCDPDARPNQCPGFAQCALHDGGEASCYWTDRESGPGVVDCEEDLEPIPLPPEGWDDLGWAMFDSSGQSIWVAFTHTSLRPDASLRFDQATIPEIGATLSDVSTNADTLEALPTCSAALHRCSRAWARCAGCLFGEEYVACQVEATTGCDEASTVCLDPLASPIETPVQVGPQAWIVPGPLFGIDDDNAPIEHAVQLVPAANDAVTGYDVITSGSGVITIDGSNWSIGWYFGRIPIAQFGNCDSYAEEAMSRCQQSPYMAVCHEEDFRDDCLSVSAAYFEHVASNASWLDLSSNGNSARIRLEQHDPSEEPGALGSPCWRRRLPQCGDGLACQFGEDPIEPGFIGPLACRPPTTQCPARWPVIGLEGHRVDQATWGLDAEPDRRGAETGGGSCGLGGLADVYRFTAPEAGTYHAAVTAYEGNPLMFARTRCPSVEMQAEIGCSDDFLDGRMLNPGLGFALDADETIYIFVADAGRLPPDTPRDRYRLRVARGPLPDNYGRLPGLD